MRPERMFEVQYEGQSTVEYRDILPIDNSASVCYNAPIR